MELHWWWFRQLVVALIRIAILFLHHHYHHHNHQYISSSPSLSNESRVKKQNVIDSSMSPIKTYQFVLSKSEKPFHNVVGHSESGREKQRAEGPDGDVWS